MTMRALAVVGNVNVDLIMGPVTPWPIPGTEVLTTQDDLRPGGAAGNTGLAWAGLGVSFTAASNVGDDMMGAWLRQALSPQSNAWVTTRASTTVSVGITHPGDDRTFFTTAGHLAHLTWPQAQAQLMNVQGGLLLLCGSFLTDRLTADYAAVFDWAAVHSVDLALDPGWPPQGWTAALLLQVRGWLSQTKHLLINEIEALHLSGADRIDTALAELLALMPEGAAVVIKAGAQGAHGRSAKGLIHVPAPNLPVLDTIGAGDIFNAGYLLATAKGGDLAMAVAAGVRLASHAISTSPRVYEMPDIQAENV